MKETNKHPKNLRIEDYSYTLAQDKIAQFPLSERDQSKLLVYQKGDIQNDSYQNIANYIPNNTLIVFNQTKVVQARLKFYKTTGSTIEIFCLEPDDRYKDIQYAMTQKSEVYWKCLVGGAQKWKKDTKLVIYNEALKTNIEAQMIDKLSDCFLIQISWGNPEISFAEILQAIGNVPLPPYMNREMDEADKDRYQTIFAKMEGSVAAPTAGLHFTDAIFKSFEQKGIQKAFLTLHVGAGTFKQVKSALLDNHEMHAEWIDVSIGFLEQLVQHKGNITAVGTTSMRTLESLYWIGLKLYHSLPISIAQIAIEQWDPYEFKADIDSATAIEAIIQFLKKENLDRLITRTQIIIAPGYTPRIVQQLVTNFHQPASTLLLLIAALVGDDWKQIYEHALQNDYRFLSYGDGCLIQF